MTLFAEYSSDGRRNPSLVSGPAGGRFIAIVDLQADEVAVARRFQQLSGKRVRQLHVLGDIDHLPDEIAGVAAAGLDPATVVIIQYELHGAEIVRDCFGVTDAAEDLLVLFDRRVRNLDLVADAAE